GLTDRKEGKMADRTGAGAVQGEVVKTENGQAFKEFCQLRLTMGIGICQDIRQLKLFSSFLLV
ncbi:hypothetical protein, partial [Prevotella pectinovora]|uniref:hypothetical protein n=1 Tax=Prevotella pectinovora TaxID=1602169 RepID=UPI00307A84FD